MGIFDKFKQKGPTMEEANGNEGGAEVKANGSEDIQGEEKAIGWDAITDVFEKIYPGQTDPKHYGTLISWQLGGNDPLEGISIYDAGDFWHFVTYGLSEIYEKESEDTEYSGYGMEFTLKLKKLNNEKEEEEIKGVCGILQLIAKITFTKGEIFYPNEYIYTGQTAGMDVKQLSKLTGFITAEDEQAGTIETPNGKVTFIELIGVTDKELKLIIDKKLKVVELYSKISNSLTDYNRDDII